MLRKVFRFGAIGIPTGYLSHFMYKSYIHRDMYNSLIYNKDGEIMMSIHHNTNDLNEAQKLHNEYVKNLYIDKKINFDYYADVTRHPMDMIYRAKLNDSSAQLPEKNTFVHLNFHDDEDCDMPDHHIGRHMLFHTRSWLNYLFN